MTAQSIAAFVQSHGLKPAEQRLLDACKAGKACELGGLPPERPDPADDRDIRAAFLRLLLLGGAQTDDLHPWGVWLDGGHITGILDLSYQTTRGACKLVNCRFAKKPQLQQTTFALLSLQGSSLPGLSAQEITVAGSLFLTKLTAKGTVDVTGARIGGYLVCEGANLDGAGGEALAAQGVQIGQSLFLRKLTAKGTVDVTGARIGGHLACEGANLDGAWGMALNAQRVQIGQSLSLSALTAKGTVDVTGARIGGQVDCEGADFDGAGGMALDAQGVQIGDGLFLRELTAKGTVDVNGAKIGGQLSCKGADLDGAGGDALNAQSLHVAQGFVFRGLASVKGRIDLTSAHVGDLVDDAASWPSGKDAIGLNGFTYDRISGAAPVTLAARKDWLDRGARFESEFSPHPYSQFARVLRAAGHTGEARKVLIERERLLFAEEELRNRAALAAAWMGDGSDVGQAWLRCHLMRLWGWFARVFSGYGHAPQRALFATLAAIGLGAVCFFMAWQAGVMVPNSPVILTSADWLAAVANAPDSPAHDWITRPSPRHYETFYPLPYAIDVFVPLVSLGQENAWAASTVSWAGWVTRWLTFVYQIVGWMITALGIAAITGFVQKNQPE